MARRQVSIFINGREVQNTLKEIGSEKRKINRELKNMVIGSAEYVAKSKELRRVNDILDDHYKKVKRVDSSLAKITGGITKFAGVAGLAFGVNEIVQYGTKLFKLSAEMEQLSKKAATVFGQALPAVTAAAKENAEAMGLTTNEYIAQTAAAGDLLIPMGFQRQEAADLSIGLIDLAGATAEWSGGQLTAEQTSKILTKALLGEREELKQLGITISEADVKDRLRAKGLENLTGNYLKQAKAIATLELITENSTDAQQAYIDNNDSLIRRQAQLSASLSELQEKLARLLLPVFERLIDVASGAAAIFLEISKSIEGIVDPAATATASLREQASAVQDLETNISPLLDRYDELTGQSELTKEEQEELRAIIEKVGNQIPSTVTEINDYGKALGINTEKAREFVAAQQALLSVKNADAIGELESALGKLEAKAGRYRETIEGTGVGLANITKKAGEFVQISSNLGGTSFIPLREDEVQDLFDTFGKLNREIDGTKLLLNELKGVANPELELPVPGGNTDDEGTDVDLEAEARAANRRKAQEKARDDQRKHLEKLAEIIRKYEEDQRLGKLDADARELEEIRLKYQKQIDLAIELEAAGFEQATAARLELEKLRDEALSVAEQEIIDRKLAEDLARDEEQFLAEQERRLAYEERRKELEAIITEEGRQAVFSDRELAIQELELYYDELITELEQYGLDTLEIEIARERALAKLRDDFRDDDLKANDDYQSKRLQATSQAFTAMGNLVKGVFDSVLDEQSKSATAGKALALIQIGISSAEAIAKATAASAGIPFPGNLAAIATAVGTVFSNIGQARRLLADTPEVPQRKKGRWMSVRGEDDKKTYRAEGIGAPGTGFLPDHPVLINSVSGQQVLGSENGTEYFVANHNLRNPEVYRRVMEIDNLVRQRNTGGFSSAGGAVSNQGTQQGDGGTVESSAINTQILAAVLELNRILQNGILARVDDDTVIDLLGRTRALDKASGGALL